MSEGSDSPGIGLDHPTVRPDGGESSEGSANDPMSTDNPEGMPLSEGSDDPVDLDELPDDSGSKLADPSASEDGQTHSTSKRHWLTNDGLAWLLTLGFLGIVAAAGTGLVDLTTVPSDVLWAFVVSFLLAVTWAFGTDAIETWRRGGGGG